MCFRLLKQELPTWIFSHETDRLYVSVIRLSLFTVLLSCPNLMSFEPSLETKLHQKLPKMELDRCIALASDKSHHDDFDDDDDDET